MLLYILSRSFGYDGRLLLGVFTDVAWLDRLIIDISKEDELVVEVVKLNDYNHVIEFYIKQGQPIQFGGATVKNV